jgi:two-component system chemotaxis response regulator CheB
MTRAIARVSGHSTPAWQSIRLMIIDDSLVARTALKRMVEGGDGMEVVVAVNTAEAALEELKSVRVDVILLDLEMPGMGGLQALPKIIEQARGARILVVSAFTVDGADQTLAALSLGATAAIPKPSALSFTDGYRDVLIGKISELGRAGKESPAFLATDQRPVVMARPASSKPARALAIGASTGGIHALAGFFATLQGRVGIPIFITQHLPGSFMTAFARQLTIASGYPAVIAEDEMVVQPDCIHIAPGDAHLTVRSVAGRLVIRLDRTPAASGCLPSVDPMFASLAEEFGQRALGVVLSGMGRDGAQGAARIVAAGGSIFAQDEASCAVWGMPRAVAEAGLASAVLPPEGIACRVNANIGSRHGNE